MFKLPLLILKNLGRSRLRTAVSGLAVAALVTICLCVSAVTSSIGASVASQAGQTKLYLVERWVNPSRLPLRYVPRIVGRRGVIDWSVWHVDGGFFDATRRSDRAGIGIATRVESLQTMHNDLEQVDPAEFEALKKMRTGAIVGQTVLDQMHWKVGDEFTFISAARPGRDLRFRIVGSIPSGLWSRSFFFRDDYFLEATGERSTVSAILVRTAGPEDAQRLMTELNREFSSEQPELKIETESAGVARLAARSAAILRVIDVVVLVLFIDMVVVLSNAISISTRERRAELAILRVYGFLPIHVIVLIVGESIAVGAISGLVGGGAAWGACEAARQGLLPPSHIATIFRSFPIDAGGLLVGAALGMFVGFVGSLAPAWNSRNIQLATVFSRVA